MKPKVTLHCVHYQDCRNLGAIIRFGDWRPGLPFGSIKIGQVQL